MKYKIALLAIVTIALLAVRPSAEPLEAASGIYSDSLTFTTNNFDFEIAEGVDVYTSPPIESPLPFNVLFPSWTVSGDKTAVSIHIRTSKTGDTWGGWQSIAINHDWMLPEDTDIVGDIILVPSDDNTHTYLQYRLEITDSSSSIDELLFTIIDSTAGPTTAEMLAQQAELDANKPQSVTTGHPKPTVISRDVWCLHEDCNYTDGLEYSPTTHLIVHHTAGGNHDPSTTNWHDVVRAVWHFHTYSRGWGDIGYNYLVDPNGVLYEGHLGGDDVKGIHASAANLGSMALSFMGNFTDTPPYNPMLNSAVDLFAWKADQRGINVFDAGSMPNLAWGLPNLSGHRDVYGGTNTECPGEKLHEYIPFLQTEVAAAIGFIDPAIYVNEMSNAFTMSNPNIGWYNSPKGCGNLRHGYYTFSVTNPDHATNWGEWTLDVPTNGRYQLDAYVPFCTTGEDETSGAAYEISHAGGQNTVIVSQQDEVGLWISLGEINLLAGDGGLVRLTDLTTTDEGLGVWFDSLRLIPVDGLEATAVNLIPANDSWTTLQTVDFEWELTNTENIHATTLQAATDVGFTQIITETAWQTAVSSHTIPLAQDYAAVHWRVQLELNDGTQFTSNATHFGIDSTPPTSTITSLMQPDNVTYVIALDGEDTLVGVDYYNVDYREAGNTAWIELISGTTANTITATLPIVTPVYEFRSQAVDLLGNIEPPHDAPDAVSTPPITTATAVNLIPANNSWTTVQTINFEWALSNPENIVTVTLQAATDAGFTDMITETEWITAVSSHTIPLAQDYAAVHWRVQLDLNDGTQFTSNATHFGIDSTPPTSTITSLMQPDDVTYVIALEGEDTLVGVDYYNVEYREAGNTAWIELISGTTASTITATLPIVTPVYEFRSQAVDLLGNIEPPHDAPDAVSTPPITTATAVNLIPANNSWTTVQTINFEWALSNPENIVTVTLQAATDAGFTNMITETEWITAVTSHTIPFAQPYPAVHWRVQLALTDGTQIASNSTRFSMGDARLINGTFEGTDGWVFPSTPIPAAYSGEQAHGGLRSARIGLTDTMTQTYGYSSVQQTITLPDGLSGNMELHVALSTLADEEEVAMQTMNGKTAVSASSASSLMDIETDVATGGDLQYGLLLDPADGSTILATLYWGLWNEQAWQEILLPIPPSLAGQEVILYFGVKNDGENGRTGMYVDDASLWIIPSYQVFLPMVIGN